MARNRRIKSIRKSAKSAAPAARRAPQPGADRPTPEMETRVKFDLGQVTTETGLLFGFAYRRRPLIESMGVSGGLSPDELNALRFYRTAFDRSERSPMRSCLNISGVGGTNAASNLMNATPAMIDAKRKVRFCESGLGPLLTTMRGVVLDDRSFSDLAMDRFGSRLVKASSGRTRVAPKSGRHREAIRQEFIAGMRVLTDQIRHMITTGGTEEVWVDPQDDGTATIRRSVAAPAGRYRCWGDNILIDRVMAALHEKYGDVLAFKSADIAIFALQKIEEGRLRHLEPEELAA